MRVRGMLWGVLVVGGAVIAGGCGPTNAAAEPGDESARRVGEGAAAAPQFCGGIANIPCPDGFVCVDAPKDDCDPNGGGADCGGICVPAATEAPLATCGGEPGYSYVISDPKACRGVSFKCPGGSTAFFNDCGCGCRTLTP
jgi:hypothetical protein